MGIISRIEGIWKGAEGGLKAGEEARKTVKAAHSGKKARTVMVKRYDPYTNNNEVTEGVLSSSSTFLIIPSHSDICMNVAPYWENGVLMVQKSARCHYAEDFRKIDAIISQIKQKFKVKFTYADFVEHLEFEDVEVSYDLGWQSNSWSMSLGSDSIMVAREPILEMVMQTPNRQLIYIAIVMYLLGVVCGGVFYMALLYFVR